MAVRSVVTDSTPVLCTYFYRANWKGLRGKIQYVDGYNQYMNLPLTQHSIRQKHPVSAMRIGTAPRNAIALNHAPVINPAPGKRIQWTLGLFRRDASAAPTYPMLPKPAVGRELNGEQLCMQGNADLSYSAEPYPVGEEFFTAPVLLHLEYIQCDTPR